MERKTKHRILGTLVMIGLGILLLPLFQNGKELKSQASLVTAPPFPDHAVQAASVVAPEIAKADQPAPTQKPQTADDMNTPDDTISVVHPSVVNQQVPAILQPNDTITTAAVKKADARPVASQPQSDANPENKLSELAPAISEKETATARMTSAKMTKNDAAQAAKISEALLDSGIQTKSPTHHKTVKLAKAKTTKKLVHVAKHTSKNKLRSVKPVAVHGPINNDGLAAIKNAAWVVQIGSFKNKSNALRLVNQLRANGYRAFIQQISTAFGENTRVFVGPEVKRINARALADRLETNMHIRGIVISYKPLTL